MAITAFGGLPRVPIGAPKQGMGLIFANATNTLNATLFAMEFIGQVFTDDGASHTIDTTLSSSLGWLAGAQTFVNVATSVKVGLAPVDTANGPPARASNAVNVVSYDVSKSYTSAGTPTASAWNESVPDTGTKTIANGDLVAFVIQMVVRGGVDSLAVISATEDTGGIGVWPTNTQYNGTTYAGQTSLPNCTITFSDGHTGFFLGGMINSSVTTQSWNNTSGTKEYGNFFQLPVPVSIIGLTLNCSVAGNCDFVLYSNPLDTPAAQKTISIDLNTVGIANSGRYFDLLFASPYTLAANTPVAGIIKPSSSTNVTSMYISMNTIGHQSSYGLGSNCYAINRNAGAFAAQNSNKDRWGMGLLLGGSDNGAGGPVGQQCM